MLKKIQPGMFFLISWCCSYLSTELGINQWPLTLEKCCDWWREDSDRDSLWQIPCDWYVHHSWLQSKSQRLHHLMSENSLQKDEKDTLTYWKHHFCQNTNVLLHFLFQMYFSYELCLTLGCILSAPVMNWAWPPPSLANPLIRAELAPSPIPKEKHLQYSGLVLDTQHWNMMRHIHGTMWTFVVLCSCGFTCGSLNSSSPDW